MRHGAGAAPPRSRYIGAASLFLLGSSLFLLGIFVLGFAASRALAGETLEPDVGTDTTTTTALTTTTAPAPDPKPPVPNPDPKPGRVQKRASVTPPPPPPPAPRHASRQPATQEAAAPTRRAQTLRRARKAAAQKQAAAALATARAQRLKAQAAKKPRRAARAKVAHAKPAARAKPVVRRKHPTRKHKRSAAQVRAATVLLDPAPLPVLGPRLASSEDAGSAALPLVAPILGLGLLALGASAVSPRRVPWPAVAQPLHVHRSDLAVAGVGLIGLALLALNVIVAL